jgi:hypothetical protein
VGVEPTIRPAKDRIAGFEDREGHRTLFASVESIGVKRAAIQIAAICVRINAATKSYSAGLVHTS